MPWYEDYFTEDFWTYADAEYTPERTRTEVSYLARVLAEHAPGRRVLDLGCGTGRHAIGLARLGFDVTGVDVVEQTLARASAEAAEAGARVRFCRADLLTTADWGVGQVDAAICVQAFGWGTDADQLRMLRAVRELLPEDGLLVLDHSSILAITKMYQPRAQATIGQATFAFHRQYDPVTGRSAGQVRVRRADGSLAVLSDDIRMYSPAEVGGLLARAGFEVLGVDADFRAGRPVTIGARYVQFLARPASRVESALAGHQGSPGPAEIDLRWAPDEADFAAPAVAAAWAKVAAEPSALPDLARRYDLTDPYGGHRAAPVLSAQLGFGSALSADRVSVGAGVTGLLHDLAGLADGGTVLTAPDGHPQLAEAAAAAGIRVAVAPLPDPVTAIAAVAEFRPAVTVLDRPTTTGERWTLPMIGELAASTAGVGGVLVVDESYACYLPPGDSAAPLTQSLERLIVVRGVSKGFCCGGLRIGFAICSPGLAVAVRSVLAPLACSALALDVALQLLSGADQLGPLRERIAVMKPALECAVRATGIGVLPTDPRVPWIVLRRDPATEATLASCRLVAKAVPVLCPASAAAGPGLLRMSVPLSAERAGAVMAALARAADGGHRGDEMAG
ncbi:MAG TPA: aminotransferase class I/II-fold pyridoxal phosphate-dependent enzyme [Streptosporangiaceae bacterium]|nr:aminotransferase class I/II-fold pyridoxal phosphate-dependent enzyme [Streptosporangiaceae bacterium]